MPDRFWRYAYTIEKMPIGQCIIVDRKGNHQFIEKWTEYTTHHLNAEKTVRLRPMRRRVPFDGEILEEEEGEKKKWMMWRTRALRLAGQLIDNGIIGDYVDLAEALGLSESYANRLWYRIKDGEFE